MNQLLGLLPLQDPVGPVEKTEEVNAIESLQPTDYKKANLEELARNCLDLSREQQEELLLVLKLSKLLFVWNQKERKGKPVMITLIKDA